MGSDNLPWKTIVVDFGDEKSRYELDATERLETRMKRSKKRSLSKQIQSIQEDTITKKPKFVIETNVIFTCPATTVANDSLPIYTDETFDLAKVETLDSPEMNFLNMDKSIFDDNSINLLPNIDDQNVFMSNNLYDEVEDGYFFG